MSSRRAPVIEAVCSPSHRSQRSFTWGPSLAPAWQGLSIIPQTAVRFLGRLHVFLLLSFLLPHSSPFHPLWLLHLEPFPSLHAQSGDATIEQHSHWQQELSEQFPCSNTHLQMQEHPASPVRTRAPWHEAWSGGM